MKTILRTSLFIFIVFFNSSMTPPNAISESINQDPEIILVSSKDEVTHLKHKEALSLKVVSSLNFGTKKKLKNEALDEFKLLAQAKGYTHLYIDAKESSKKHHEIGKRNFTVEYVGVAYK